MSKCSRSFGIVLTALFCASISLAPPASAQDKAAAPPAEYVKLSPAELDKLVGPIALYPDPLIVQIVTCAGSPYQVNQVNAWLKANPDLKGTAVQDAATEEGFDASFVAISLFPEVVQKMADQPEWTKQLGEAFAKDRSGVFASIQRLRTQAQSVGNLKSNEQQSVETVATSGGSEVIVIQPANPQIVYVPQYDPQVVYVQTLPTTTVIYDDDDDVIAAGVIGFTAGIFLGAAIDNDYHGCGGWGWHGSCLSDDDWDDFSDHRQDMANDFYDHREEMAEKRGKNQENRQEGRTDRQDNRGENQSGRQDSRNENQSGRQDNRDQNQSGRQDSRGERQDSGTGNSARTGDSARSADSARTGDSSRQNTRQDTSANRQPSSGMNKASKSSRGSTTNRAQSSTGTNSSAFSGYQKGSNERASSSRGNSSVSKSSSGSRSASSGSRSSGSRSSGGGGSRSGGSRGGGGGGRGGGGRR